MNSKHTLSDNIKSSQLESPYDCESVSVSPNTQSWILNASGLNTGYSDTISLLLDKIYGEPTESNQDDFITCPECHFEAPNHSSDCVAVAVDDFEVLGKQHLMVQGLMCQNGCKEFATERVQDEAINGMPIDKLVCEACAFGEVNE